MVCVLLQMLLHDYELQGNKRVCDPAWNTASRVKMLFSWRTKMAAQVGTLRLLVQPELTENQRARKSDTKQIKKKHTSRPVGGAETGTGVERTRVAMVGPRLAECGTNGAGGLTTSRPCVPTLVHRLTGTNGGERGRQRNPGLQRREIKPQTSD